MNNTILVALIGFLPLSALVIVWLGQKIAGPSHADHKHPTGR